jgi:hypothetical protein
MRVPFQVVGSQGHVLAVVTGLRRRRLAVAAGMRLRPGLAGIVARFCLAMIRLAVGTAGGITRGRRRPRRLSYHTDSVQKMRTPSYRAFHLIWEPGLPIFVTRYPEMLRLGSPGFVVSVAAVPGALARLAVAGGVDLPRFTPVFPVADELGDPRPRVGACCLVRGFIGHLPRYETGG